MSNFNVPIVDAPELNIPGEEVEILTHAWFSVRTKFIVRQMMNDDISIIFITK